MYSYNTSGKNQKSMFLSNILLLGTGGLNDRAWGPYNEPQVPASPALKNLTGSTLKMIKSASRVAEVELQISSKV